MESEHVNPHATTAPACRSWTANDVRRPRPRARRSSGSLRSLRPDSIGLCLSGGGYRAMLFHLGVVWRLNELGILPTLARISSVSGGSITAGVLARAWPRLDFDDRGVARAFETEVAAPIRALARRTIDIPATLWGALRSRAPGTSWPRATAGICSAMRRSAIFPTSRCSCSTRVISRRASSSGSRRSTSPTGRSAARTIPTCRSPWR